MGDFADASVIEGSAGRYRATIAPDWFAWNPMGGYLAAIVYRAMAATTAHPRPATFACQFLRAGRAGGAEVVVESLRGGRRSEALRATIEQDGAPLLTASAWFVADGLEGFVHDATKMPPVPGPGELEPYSKLAPNYDEWWAFWRYLEGRPVQWDWTPGVTHEVWQTWIRLLSGVPADPVLRMARMLLWADMLPWNAAQVRHEWPRKWIAPNLDLTVQFHAAATDDDWILCDGESEIAGNGLVGCKGRLWSAKGRLLASAQAQLFCLANPTYAEELEIRRARETEPAG